jgi:hypothetical protein
MNIITLSCTSCGAPIKVPPDLEQFNCAHCGTLLAVQRGEGYVALKLAEQIGRVINESSKRTQEEITRGTETTQAELRRLQLNQEYATAEMQLSNIRAEMRALTRQKKNRTIKKQLKDLQAQENNLLKELAYLYPLVYPSSSQSGKNISDDQSVKRGNSPKPTSRPFSESPVKMGCLTFWIISIVGIFLITPSNGGVNTDGYSKATDLVIIAGIAAGILVAVWISKRNKQNVKDRSS